ncbi:CLUMA_CG009981, isoform A [Clunio marinus]|uniref:CLUMA_CG009981, isoform A n=1 Tax=Clunio marinus TaxID=568069 RepID=A0A1J1I9D9_9DIPT|nr:CLUMA_CG009981, isoform A [Clunio marinus]
MKITIFFVMFSIIAIVSALPAPAPLPKEERVDANDDVELLKDSDGSDKDLKGSESAYYGYYSGYPYGGYSSYYYPSYYSSVYHTSPYYSVSYRPYSYWW